MTKQNPKYYNVELIKARQQELGWSDRKLAGMSDLSNTQIMNTHRGNCKRMDTLYAISTALSLKWEFLFKTDLPESKFRQAVE